MPEHFQIAVIGSGPGGYVAAIKAAQMGATVAVIEKHYLGGTCLNYGCIPSKALLASAELMHKIKNAGPLGINIDGTVSFDWPKIQQRKDKVVAKLRGGIKGLFGSGNIKLYQAEAKFEAKGKLHLLDKNGQSLQITADNIIIASGSMPARIPNWPSDAQFICTSEEALHWKELPKRLIIVGGGVIGCEFACMMSEFAVDVTIVEMLENLLPEMETALGQALAEIFKKRNIKIFTGAKVERLEIKEGVVRATISGGQSIEADKVLVATGRKPNTQELGLENIGLKTNSGFIKVNDRMQTAVKGVYCIGDANGRCLLAHAASAQGVTAVENALGHQKDFELPVPNAVYTFPEIASVGITTKQAAEQKIPVSTGQFPIGYLGKAMAIGEDAGFVKVIRHSDDGTLLGVHIIGHNATEVIGAAAAMLGAKAGADELAEMVFAHPTIGEAVKEAAEDSFQRAIHLPLKKAMQA
jgi:dihydrolipoamide dehydrogenase